MKKNLIKAGLLLTALLLQLSIAQKLNIGSFSVNLCLLTFIGVCFFSDTVPSLIFGGVYGLFIDGSIGRNFGVNILLYLYLAVAIKLFAKESHKNSPAFMAADTVMFSALFYIAYGLLSFAVPRGSISVGRWLITSGVVSVFNGVIALVFFAVKERVSKRGMKNGRTV